MHTEMQGQLAALNLLHQQGVLQHSHSCTSGVQRVHSFSSVHQHFLDSSIALASNGVQVVVGANVYNVEGV